MKSILLCSLTVAITVAVSSPALADGRHPEATTTIIRIGDIAFGQISIEGQRRHPHQHERHDHCCKEHRLLSKHEMKKARRLARRHERLHRKMERHGRRDRHRDFRGDQLYAYGWKNHR